LPCSGSCWVCSTRFPVALIVEIKAERAFLKGLSDEADVVLELFDRIAVDWTRKVVPIENSTGLIF
jgi:hypothetical protein